MPRKIQATVIEVLPHGAGVYTVIMRPGTAAPRFKAGQFLHLAIDDYDPQGGFWPDSRVFSICSRPGDEDLRIVYTVKGVFTSRMEAFLAPGKLVWLKLPFGDFVIDEASPVSKVLIAGGTGISPFMPFLESPARGGGTIFLHYGARSGDLLIFMRRLEEIARGNPSLNLRLYAESGAGDGVIQGPVDLSRVRSDAMAMEGSQVYVSGPPAMIDYFKNGLVEGGMAPSSVHNDSWE